jgi:hypothetical protein
VENIAAPNIPHIEVTSYVPASLVSFIRMSATRHDNDAMTLVSRYYVIFVFSYRHSVSDFLGTV